MISIIVHTYCTKCSVLLSTLKSFSSNSKNSAFYGTFFSSSSSISSAKSPYLWKGSILCCFYMKHLCLPGELDRKGRKSLPGSHRIHIIQNHPILKQFWRNSHISCLAWCFCTLFKRYISLLYVFMFLYRCEQEDIELKHNSTLKQLIREFNTQLAQKERELETAVKETISKWNTNITIISKIVRKPNLQLLLFWGRDFTWDYDKHNMCFMNV